MSKDSSLVDGRYTYTQNRELSWLRFNQRVLEEAEDVTNPPMERLKFIAIFSSNLDEFFMVRVGSLFDISQISPKEIDSKSGLTSFEQLDRIYRRIPVLIERKKQIYESVMGLLEESGIKDYQYSELSEAEKNKVDMYYSANILPILSPIIIGNHHPTPHLNNKGLYVATLLQEKKGKPAIGLVPVPVALAPYLVLSKGKIIRTENILSAWATTLFGDYSVVESCVISVTRNADVSLDEDKFEDNDSDFRERVMKLLKLRNYMSVMRLEISHSISEEFRTILQQLVRVEPHQTYVDTTPLNMKYVYRLAGEWEETKELSYEPYSPRWPEDISPNYSIIDQIRQKDKLLFFPYDSVDPFLKLLTEAAQDPNVLSIKITIYRLASSSKIAQTLCRAAENGKEVLVLMELRARFDEANNVEWSKLLEDSGCQVVYGIENFKCHSKICLITMRGKGQVNYITQIGTGNYNEKTNAMYTDLSVMTSSHNIGSDATAFFQNMLVNNLEGQYKHLLVSPLGIKSGICEKIDREIAKGADGYVCIKANSVTEREVIDKLREASRAGVEIHLIIRGICCILPGIPAETEHIEVSSIVGRFLEHARIYCFGRGDEAQMYIASADLMTRNLNRRVEIACPIYDSDIKAQLRWILDEQLRDNVKAGVLQPDGTYLRKQYRLSVACSSQEEFMKNSLHKRTSYEPEKKSNFDGFFAWFKNIFKK